MIVTFGGEQSKRLLDLPERELLKTTLSAKFSPHLYDLFSLTALLLNADLKRVHECLQYEAQYFRLIR